MPALMPTMNIGPISITATKTVRFDTTSSDYNFINTGITKADDYDVLVDGNGYVNQATKSATAFTVTVTSGTVTFTIVPRQGGAQFKNTV